MSTQTQTQADQNKRTARKFIDEGLNKHDLGIMDDFYAPDVTYHGPGGRELRGIDEMRTMVQGYLTAFPDLRMTVLHQIAEDDLVATVWRAFGTNDGPMGEIPATHKSAEVSGQVIARFKGGKVIEEWEVFDEMGMLTQLGLAGS